MTRTYILSGMKSRQRAATTLTSHKTIKTELSAHGVSQATLSRPLVAITGSYEDEPGVYGQAWHDDERYGAQLQIKDMASLDSNWDSHGAPPISEQAISTAVELATWAEFPLAPMISPTPESGIAFEWRSSKGDLTLEITNDGELEVIYHLRDEDSWAGPVQEAPLELWQIFQALWDE